MEQSPEQHPPSTQDEDPNSFGLRDCAPWFVGMTIGTLIGDHLFNLDFSDVSAAPRAAIATGLLYGGHKVWDKIKSSSISV